MGVLLSVKTDSKHEKLGIQNNTSYIFLHLKITLAYF